MSNYIMSFENITILIFILNSLADINKSIWIEHWKYYNFNFYLQWFDRSLINQFE